VVASRIGAFDYGQSTKPMAAQIDECCLVRRVIWKWNILFGSHSDLLRVVVVRGAFGVSAPARPAIVSLGAGS
jgi:hypothetical protein